ncbi:MAG: HAMP domain-containing protein, partial [Gammaproteobacteria bacterium]|nr:HAMP domain-containing protein [Gammaproteobacteria bacterium]
MARLIDTLSGRFGIIVLMIHVLLLPALYLGVDRIVTRSHEEMFITEIRTYARVLADELELGSAMESEARVEVLLENVLLSGEGVFAELVAGNKVIHSEPDPQGRATGFPGEDFEFGAGGDDIYFLSIPIVRNRHEAVLRIGFDERPVIAQIGRARARILIALGAYFLVSLWLAVYLGRLVARPLVELKQASRRVASGDMTAGLSTDSEISELRELADDLETMRAELVAVSRRLREEMRERETTE